MGAPWAMAALLWFATGVPVAGPVASVSAHRAVDGAHAYSADDHFSEIERAVGALPSAPQVQAKQKPRPGVGTDPLPGKEQLAQRTEGPLRAAGELGGFGVEIISPSPTDDIAGRIRVRAEVAADRPAEVAAVDFFIDGRLMFSDARAPYELMWNSGRPADHRIEVRAYGPGRQMVSDSLETRFDGSGSSLGGFSARVERVELHVRVEGEKPLEGPLDATMFEVYENDVLQPVVAVERVADLPLAVGLLVDHSGSMLEQLDTALDAAATFVDGLLTHPDDKAFVLGFADVPIVFQEFTNDAARLADSISLIEDGRHTALYDAIVTASRRFAGIDGRRAVILLTDGADEGSEHRFRDAIAAAQRADVALYPVAVELSPRHVRERWTLHQLAEQTGGRFFSLGRRSDPTEIYEAVQDDLRAQYRISYSPLVPGGRGEWRELLIRLRRHVDRERGVRSRPGYFAQ